MSAPDRESKRPRILITGASSGIGRATALELAARGARLVLVARRSDELEAACDAARAAGGDATPIVADLVVAATPQDVVRGARRVLGEIDILVNVAGVNAFAPFVQQSSASLERMFQINVLAPMRLVQAALPSLTRVRGRIVNVGSIFGSIGFPYFTAYSASKFALRGFSEALRRELADTGVTVAYVAPRATRTPMALESTRMADAVGMALDEPADVARAIADAALGTARERYLGFPERLFVRINALAPRVVDAPLIKQARVMARFAADAARSTSSTPTHAARTDPVHEGVSS